MSPSGHCSILTHNCLVLFRTTNSQYGLLDLPKWHSGMTWEPRWICWIICWRRVCLGRIVANPITGSTLTLLQFSSFFFFNISCTKRVTYIPCKQPTWRRILFLIFVYSNSLHVSSNQVLIIRKVNCISTTSGTCQYVGDRVVCRFRWNCRFHLNLHTTRSPTSPSLWRYSPGWALASSTIRLHFYLASSPSTALSSLPSGLLPHRPPISHEVFLYFFLQTVFLPSSFLASLPLPFSLHVPARSPT